MFYDLYVSDRALKRLKKIMNNDKGLAKRILNKIEQILEKPHHYNLLTGDLKGARKGKVGNYRVIFDINDKKNLVFILDIGHRKEIYSSQNISKIKEFRRFH